MFNLWWRKEERIWEGIGDLFRVNKKEHKEKVKRFDF